MSRTTLSAVEDGDVPTDAAPVVSLDRARFIVDMDALGTLRHRIPGSTKPWTDIAFMDALVAACDAYGATAVSSHLGTGKSTVQDWCQRHRTGITKRDRAVLAKTKTPDAVTGQRDVELIAIQQCVRALESLEDSAKQRVLNYLDERFFSTWKPK
jgi:hypothetical protein